MPKRKDEKSPAKYPRIKPIAFGERVGAEPYNASEIVAVDDSRFLFCDNNVGDALFELRLKRDGTMARSVVRRRLRGIEPGSVDDLEGMTRVRTDGGEFLVVMPSLSLKRRKGHHKKKNKRGKAPASRGVLLRVSHAKGGTKGLETEVLADFREWVVENSPELRKSPRWLPDDGGLNVEGLGWSPADQALLLGVRTPVDVDGRPIVLRVRIKDVAGPWTLDNFEMLPPVSLAIEHEDGEQGIRTIGFNPTRGEHGEWLIVAGNSTSDSKAPFTLHAWDGNTDGVVRTFEKVRFHRKMKVEGVTHGTVGGRGAIAFVDDAGGYAVVWDDDPRLT